MKRKQATLESIWIKKPKTNEPTENESVAAFSSPVPLAPSATSTNDISVYARQHGKLTDEERDTLLSTDWKPSEKHMYKKTQFGKTSRTFQSSWLQKYPGLVYSVEEDGAYCVHCVTFPGNKKRGKLVSEPFQNWKKAIEVFDGHFFPDAKKHSKDGGTGYQAHIDSRICCEQFMSVRKNNAPVNKQVDAALQARRKKNAVVLESITKTVLLCARQNIALRGHSDSSKYYDDESVNCGNFQSLIEFRVESGDSVLKEHFATSVCVRFIDESDKIREEFLRFVDVSPDTSGEALSQAILDVLTDVGLDPSMMRSQCYDGAGNMTGKTKGVGPRIQHQYPRALPFWCTAHQLNRCVVHASNSTLVRNMMGTVDRIAVFFNYSPRRQTCLAECRAAMEVTESKRQKIKSLCRTRWVERHDALEVFIDFLPAMVDAMSQLMENETKSTTSAEISGFLMAITGFQFIAVLVIVTRCLSYIKPLTVALQGRSVDVVKAMSQVSVVQQALQEVRDNIDTYHNTWFQEVSTIADNLGVQPSQPRLCGRQTKRDNIEAATPELYYKRNLTIPFVDTFVNEMDTRFSDLQTKAAMGLKLIPEQMCASPVSASDLEWFIDDLPSPQSLPAELHLWQARWKGVTNPPTTLQGAVEQCDSQLYPNIYTVLSIACVFPVTSCECERSISALGLVKTKLRTSMGQDRLSALCLLSVHRDIDINICNVVREFARKHPRRMDLPDILSEL
ncbi:52 kDa repressor of the inhibitor of the protein kinase-like [Dreissena polymorpha]|uniref:52 kDa repressor of the inhibitor of the protein kinase-like n=1 Tax=Dreissena polymorpha TaxID=45954 RepID=UPI0022653FCA|nr:52 kDa repressor of the inhibitor of the protein kinase-like [Dreissena polymorpha]